MNTRTTHAILLTFLLLVPPPAARSDAGFPFGELDSYIMEFLDWYAIPGMSVAVVQGDEVVFSKGYGVTNVETGEPVTPRTLYSTASVTKLFVATAVMQLVERGLVSLDAPVVTYLPYFRLNDERYRTITVRHMLSHTSGMPDTDGEEFYNSWRKPEYDGGALERYVRGLGDVALVSAPGEQYRYSNMAFDVLGDLVAKVSGLSLEEYVRRAILAPLGMKNSTLLYRAADSALVAAPHRLNGDLAYEVSDLFPYTRRHAACGTLFSNVIDMCRWAMANNNRGVLGGIRILQESSYDVMWSPAVSDDNPVGIGWLLESMGSYKMYSHGGGDPGFRTEFYVVPEKAAGVVVMTNSWEENITPVALKALALVLGQVETDWFEYYRGTLWKCVREDGVDAAAARCRELTRHNGTDNFHPAILNQLGNRLAELDRAEDACRLFELNVEYYPGIYQLRNVLAESYLELGRKDAADRAARRSLELKPGNEQAVRILERLEDAKK